MFKKTDVCHIPGHMWQVYLGRTGRGGDRAKRGPRGPSGRKKNWQEGIAGLHTRQTDEVSSSWRLPRPGRTPGKEAGLSLPGPRAHAPAAPRPGPRRPLPRLLRSPYLLHRLSLTFPFSSSLPRLFGNFNKSQFLFHGEYTPQPKGRTLAGAGDRSNRDMGPCIFFRIDFSDRPVFFMALRVFCLSDHLWSLISFFSAMYFSYLPNPPFSGAFTSLGSAGANALVALTYSMTD